MKKGLKIVLITCVILFILGGIFIAVGIANGGSMAYYIDYKNHKISSSVETELISGNDQLDAFSEFDIDVDAAKVTIVKGDSYNVEYKLYKRENTSINVENGKLVITTKIEKNTFNFDIFSDDQNPYIKITIPENAELSNGKINTDAGSVILSNLDMKDLSLGADYGEVEIKDSSFNNLDIETNAGSVTFDNVKAEKAVINTDYGDVNITGTEVGDIKLDMDAGDLDVDSTKLDNIEIDGDYGDVELKLIGEKADYEFRVSVDAGKISVDGEKEGTKYNSNEGKDKKIKIDVDAGDVDIDF